MDASRSPGISALASEVATGISHLLGQHVKIAKLELQEELHAIGRRATLIAVLAALVALGYGMAMTALAFIIGGQSSVGIPLVVVGLAHMAGGGLGLVLSPHSPGGSGMMENSKEAMASSLAVLKGLPAPAVVCSKEQSGGK
jgi:hypothetical protein